MLLTQSVAILSGLIAPALALPRGQIRPRGSPDPAKAEAVKEAYQLSWKAYYDHAFPNDTLHPVSNSYENDRARWGVTAVDALSTAILLRDAESVNQILEFIPTIDFTTTAKENEEISIFETNIRYVGGLLSGYDLLQDDAWSDLVSDPSLVESLKEQVISLADSIKFAFDTPSGVPESTIILNPEPKQKGSTQNNLAEVGTLILEWTRLSDISGNPEYGELAAKAESYLLKPTPESGEPFPGLTGTWISLENGTFLDGEGGWSGYTDSFYEYLIKMYLYDPEAYGDYKDRWVVAAESTIEHLASHPTSREDLTFLAAYRGTQRVASSGHLAAFAGGNFILGGILLGEQKYIDFGLTLADSYFEPYRQTTAGIGPEGFRWTASEFDVDGDANTNPPTEEQTFYDDAGFWVTSPQYILRPETIESLYYSYRATGDSKWQDLAWQAFQNIEAATKMGSAFSSIRDVTVEHSESIDKMESFWLAETLKYLYLIFSEESEVQVNPDGGNQWVYNTEAHPVRVRGS